ncbi:MAG: 4Fe-4S dicluster domain-containing protein [Candidatus Omnitrophica bacterium]|nr:4Fe-4S dicluster domain-containing protein [Candidatus Omnitrophota bacterium]
MMRVLTKEDLKKLINSLSNSFEVIGPKEIPNKGVFYSPITGGDELYMGDSFAIEPAKKFFLKPSCAILSEKPDGGFGLEDVGVPSDKRVIIGLRPCEARGLTLLDKIFDAEHKDKFYIEERSRTTLIGLACDKPDRGCFCTSMGGSPADGQGLDAIIFAAEGQYIVEVITDKGREIIGSTGKKLDDGEQKARKSDKKKRHDSVKTKITPPEGLDKMVDNDYWSEVSRACVSCGICTYLCPTCHCFDLVDEERKRLRCYDGCSFPDFTLEASGVNPRPTKKERYRQRVYHKFDYFKKNFGENLCVGCGRCIRYCPVKIDIAAIADGARV